MPARYPPPSPKSKSKSKSNSKSTSSNVVLDPDLLSLSSAAVINEILHWMSIPKEEYESAIQRQLSTSKYFTKHFNTELSIQYPLADDIECDVVHWLASKEALSLTADVRRSSPTRSKRKSIHVNPLEQKELLREWCQLNEAMTANLTMSQPFSALGK
jgi:hypothetical protein